MKIRCSRCKHQWDTKSKYWKVTCPNCYLKVDNHVMIKKGAKR